MGAALHVPVARGMRYASRPPRHGRHRPAIPGSTLDPRSPHRVPAPSTLPFGPSDPPVSTRRTAGLAAFAAVLLLLHAWHVWGHTSLMWGDIGRWSHEVERLANGELPYRDFQWHYPPLGLWVEGMLARIVGTDHPDLTAIATALSIVIAASTAVFSQRVLRRDDPLLLGASLVLAFAYAQTNGPALPMGLYSPGALVGAVCIAIALVAFVRELDAPSSANATWMALWAGLAVLSKQDFWIPSAYIVGVSFLRSRQLLPPLVSAAVVALGLGAIVATAGASVILPMVGGFGHARLAGGQGFPSWERLTVDFFALAAVCGPFLVLLGLVTRRWHWRSIATVALLGAATGALFVAMTMQVQPPAPGELPNRAQDLLRPHLATGGSLLRPAAGLLVKRWLQTPLPVSLPPLLLLLTAWRWRALPAGPRGRVALLLGLAIALRARRAFEATEWVEFLFTVPILLLAVELLVPLDEGARRRLRLATGGALAVLALLAYKREGRGWGTDRYFPAVTETLRGNVHWSEGGARDYRRILATVDSLDPSRQRPLFAFGFSGGWNYWLKRRNPYPFTQDFYYSAFDADSVLALPRPAGLILFDLDPRLLDTGGSYGAARFDVRRWEQPRVAPPYGFYDRPRFMRLMEGCTPVPLERVIVKIYQCP